MTMRQDAHIAIKLALLQVMVVLIGTFVTRVAFMGNGYPDRDADWNRFSLLLRGYGFVLLLVPLVWTCTVMWLEHRSAGSWTRRWTILSGCLLLALLAFLFFRASTHTYNGRMRLVTVGHVI